MLLTTRLRGVISQGLDGFIRSLPFCANAKAWEFFQACPPSYRKTALSWLINAKPEAPRRKRLAQLILDSEQGRTIAPLTRRPKAE